MLCAQLAATEHHAVIPGRVLAASVRAVPSASAAPSRVSIHRRSTGSLPAIRFIRCRGGSLRFGRSMSDDDRARGLDLAQRHGTHGCDREQLGPPAGCGLARDRRFRAVRDLPRKQCATTAWSDAGCLGGNRALGRRLDQVDGCCRGVRCWLQADDDAPA